MLGTQQFSGKFWTESKQQALVPWMLEVKRHGVGWGQEAADCPPAAEPHLCSENLGRGAGKCHLQCDREEQQE